MASGQTWKRSYPKQEQTRQVLEENRQSPYLTGLGIEGLEAAGDAAKCRLCATFEYSGAKSAWIVPDYELFKLLASHLDRMALHAASTDDYGYSKLDIWFEDGARKAEEP